MTFDPTKPVRTRDGRPARIICADRAGPHIVCPIVALVMNGNGDECPVWRYADGSSCIGGPHADDLVNIPEKIKLWAVIADERPGGCVDHDGNVRLSYAYLFKDKPKNLRVAGVGSRLIACKEIEFEEGEGL